MKMHPLARKHFEKVLQREELIGPNTECKYYPCHSNLEDCTWCYCPFYPCEDTSLGHYVTSRQGKKVWSCQDCNWVHQKQVAGKILEEIKKLGIKKPEDVEEKHEELLKIKKQLKGGL